MTIGDRAFLAGFIIGTIFGLLVGVGTAHSAEPQSAVIEFTSAEDLAHQADSIGNVCEIIRDSMSLWENSDGIKSLNDFSLMIRIDSSATIGSNPTLMYQVWVDLTTYRHRRLVGVTVTIHPYHAYDIDGSRYSIKQPGKAVVWFEWEME